MTKYKASLYNLLTYDLDGSLLVANLLNNSFIKFSEKYQRYNIERIQNMLEGKEELSEEITKNTQLIKDGFIIQEDINESDIADYKYETMVYGNDTLELTIIPTDSCNFRCVYCYEESNEYTYMTPEIERNILTYIKKNVAKYKMLKINWFGGEPLLMKDMVIDFMEKAIAICKEKKVPILSSMTTNGYELNEETFRRLLGVKVCFYQITVDGIKETHNKQRPHKENDDSYERIMENLINIMENVEQYYHIVLRINMTKSTLGLSDQYIEEMKKFSKYKKITISWERVADYGGEKVHSLASDMIEGTKQYEELIDKSTQQNLSSSYITNFGIGATLCTANQKNSFYINTDGKVFKCSLAIYDSVHLADNTIGYINNQGDMIIDETKNSKWLVRHIASNDCKKCTYYPVCFSAICPYRNKIQKHRVCYKRYEMSKAYLRSMSKQGIFKEIGECTYG